MLVVQNDSPVADCRHIHLRRVAAILAVAANVVNFYVGTFAKVNLKILSIWLRLINLQTLFVMIKASQAKSVAIMI